MSLGRRGECPDWFRVYRAAQRLQCSPWELLEQPEGWIDISEEAEAALDWARREMEKRRRPF